MLIIDTDIFIDVLRHFPPAIQWLSANIAEEIVLPGFVVMELMQGCRNKQELRLVQQFADPFPLLWPSPEVADQAMATFAEGNLTHRLGILDALIGQIAVSLNSPLHTFNQKHFAAVPGLQTVQPYAR